MNKRTRNILVAIVALILLVLVTSPRVRFFETLSGKSAEGNAPDMRMPVTAVVLVPEKIENKIMATGTVMANEEVELKSETSGKITRIAFKEGSRVKKGQLLAKINDAELQASLAKMESQEKVTADKERRRRQLFEGRNISPEDYEITLNELNAVRAEVDLIKAKIDKTEIRAPFDGMVGLRYVSEGSYVSSETRIATLQDRSLVKVDFAVPEKYAAAVHKDQAINFSAAGSQQKYRGKIYAIAPKIDPVTRTVQIRAICPNPEGRIVPGGFAEVELVLEELPNALMVPTEAIVPDLKGQKVFVYRDGAAHARRVDIGLRTDTKVQVKEGLQQSDTVITSGLLQLIDGLPVRLSQFN